MKTQKSSSGLCVYCGVCKGATRDHIPPKSLFAKPRPSNLITVPCCRECNVSASIDDEYFRLMVSARHDTAQHPDASEVNRAALRGLILPEKKGLKKHVLNISKEVYGRTRAGIHLGRVGIFEVDLERLGKVVTRNIIGLYYHHFKSRLPSGHQAFAWAFDGLEQGIFEEEGIPRQLLMALLETPWNVIGKAVLRYRFRVLEEAEGVSAWLLSYYERVHFLGLTAPDGSSE